MCALKGRGEDKELMVNRGAGDESSSSTYYMASRKTRTQPLGRCRQVLRAVNNGLWAGVSLQNLNKMSARECVCVFKGFFVAETRQRCLSSRPEQSSSGGFWWATNLNA